MAGDRCLLPPRRCLSFTDTMGDAGRRRPPTPKATARASALHALCELEGGRASLDSLLEHMDAGLADSRDRRLARRLVLGVLQWRDRLDWCLNAFSHHPVSDLPTRVRQILRIAAFQLQWLDRVPARAAIHSAVELAKRDSHPGLIKLVNAILRRMQREGNAVEYPDRREDLGAYLAVYYSHPRWLVDRWLQRWGEDRTEALLRVDNEAARLYVRLNTLRADQSTFAASLPAGFAEPKPVGPLPEVYEMAEAEGLFASPAYRDGYFLVQDISAGLAVALLDPQPGERVLDVCSAPGGKAAQMAIAMRDSGAIVACDNSPNRLRRVRENATRLGLRSIAPVAEDGTVPSVATVEAGGDRHPGLFDRILVDAPCSSTGVLSRHPDARWRRTAATIPRMADTQFAILTSAFARLRPGGVLVYSTCTLEEEENDGVVDRFLTTCPTARLEPASHRFPGCVWAQRCIQALPGREPGDGAFAARLRRRPA